MLFICMIEKLLEIFILICTEFANFARVFHDLKRLSLLFVARLFVHCQSRKIRKKHRAGVAFCPGPCYLVLVISADVL